MGKVIVRTEPASHSIQGEIRVLSKKNKWMREVELWLVNDATTRNDGRYVDIDKRKDLFAETPILVAYKHGEVGDGHNFEEIRNPDGSITASFMGATSERIVGYFKKDTDLRIEERDGLKWVVGKGYIWEWYAQELVKKLEEQGLRGMSVSIETLIDEMRMEGTTEIYEKYQILGTTILGDNVTPAVKDANIRALSAIGVDAIRQMTVRVASENQKIESQTKVKENKTVMKVKDLAGKFDGFTVLAVNGSNVALLSAEGTPYMSTAELVDDKVNMGEISEIAVNAVFGEGENAVSVQLDKITERLNAEIAELKARAEQAESERTTALNSLEAMQKAEKTRRKNAVKEAIKTHLAEIKDKIDVALSEEICADLSTDEKVEEYAEMESEGEFCGDIQACKDVDSACMNEILKSHRSESEHKYVWDIVANSQKESEDKEGSFANKAVKNVMKK